MKIESVYERLPQNGIGMDVTSALPQHEPVQLARSPIVLAIAQIRFPTIMSIPVEDRLLAQFQDKIRDFYPFLFTGHQVGFSIGPGGIEQQQASMRNYQFTDSERQWTVTLSADAVSLETRRYTDIDEFMDRLLKVIVAAKDTYRISTRQRVGLRYINEIRYSGADNAAAWRSLIKPELLGPLSDENIAHSVVNSYQELGFQIPEGGLTMRHGFYPQGTTVAPLPGTNSPTGPFYLLDFDAFDDKGRELDIKELDTLLRSYNKTIYSLFRWGIDEKLFEYLKGSE